MKSFPTAYNLFLKSMCKVAYWRKTCSIYIYYGIVIFKRVILCNCPVQSKVKKLEIFFDPVTINTVKRHMTPVRTVFTQCNQNVVFLVSGFMKCANLGGY